MAGQCGKSHRRKASQLSQQERAAFLQFTREHPEYFRLIVRAIMLGERGENALNSDAAELRASLEAITTK